MTNEHLRTSKGNNDECYTPRYGVEPLLEFMQPYQDKIIWCPFDDETSEFVKVFKEQGFKVVYSHIKYGQDYFRYEPDEWDVMISNPPFTNKSEIFKRALSFNKQSFFHRSFGNTRASSVFPSFTRNKPFALLMTITWLNDGTGANVFKDKKLQILTFNERMQFKNRKQDRKQRYASFSLAGDCPSELDTPPASRKINFLSAYFCHNFLPDSFIFRTFKNRNQMRLPL